MGHLYHSYVKLPEGMFSHCGASIFVGIHGTQEVPLACVKPVPREVGIRTYEDHGKNHRKTMGKPGEHGDLVHKNGVFNLVSWDL